MTENAMDRVLLNKRHPYAVRFTDDMVIVTLTGGMIVGHPLEWHPWLEAASPEQRQNVEFYSDAIFWTDLDEGLDLEAMLRGIGPEESKAAAE